MIIDDNTGIWLNNTLEGHGYDIHLSNALVQILKKNNISNVYDFGCGHGLYTRNLLINNILCKGYDGNPNTNQLTDNLCNVLDLSKKFELPKKEYVITLEVGEHIPKLYEETFIQNIHNHNTKGIILSWAVIGQGGDGHINCQDNHYIKQIFNDLGYTNNIDDENYLRANSSFSWFKNTIMVFNK
jgi:hypothetical protein